MSTMEDPSIPSPSSVPETENPLLRPSNPHVSTLEQEVLDEYTRLLGNVNKLSTKLSDLAGSPSSLTLDGLRMLERKTATVCTLLKASVYSIVLQQQIWNESEGERQNGNGNNNNNNAMNVQDGEDTQQGYMGYNENGSYLSLRG